MGRPRDSKSLAKVDQREPGAQHKYASWYPKLDGTDYALQKFKIKAVLVDKDIQKAISATIRKALDAKVEQKTYTILILALKDSQLSLVKTCDTAKAMSEKLDELYATRFLANKLYLRRRFFLPITMEGDSVIKCINKVTSLTGKLNSIKHQ